MDLDGIAIFAIAAIVGQILGHGVKAEPAQALGV